MIKTFEYQNKLPRLPIPTLEHFSKTYLRTVLPYLSGSELKRFESIVMDFVKPGGVGETLQKRLIDYDKTQEFSWLEKWWYQYAYLGWRNSVLVNSNWYVLAQPYLNQPIRVQSREGFTDLQIRRAAGFTSSFLNYKELVDTEQLPPETTKQGPLDMNQFRRLFGITRVPKPNVDIIVGTHPSPSKHIIVLIKDQIFVVYVYSTTGARLRVEDIARQFHECVKRVESGKRMQPPVCILGGQDRDDWARGHQYLEELDKKNKDSFHWIETALFAVSLDHRLVPHDTTSLAKNVFHAFDGHNRWSDKSLNIVVLNDGRLGVHGEHSPCDALVPALLVDYAVQAEPAGDPPYATATPSITPLFRLEFVTDSKMEDSLVKAQKFIHELIQDSDARVLHYTKYGNDFIKSVAKVSPDAFTQMCLQLAFFKLHGYTTGVYETASTRKYLHGRTETCRSHTLEQKQFVECFYSPSASAVQKYKAFQKACKAHVDYLQMASNGYGVDRHFLGLKLCLKGSETHEIFKHPVVDLSSKWELSTSGLFSGERLVGTGFGTVYSTGYGMNYMLGKNVIKIGVESKPTTSTIGYINTLSTVFDDMKLMIEQASTTPKL